MRKTKFITAIALAAALLFSACNKTETENTDVNNDQTQTEVESTARVIIEVTDYTGEPKSVKLTNLSDDNGNPTEIVPDKYDEESYTYTYVALVAPQTVAANTTFISGEFNNGDTFTYDMPQDTTWNAGGEYTYEVSLADVGSGYIENADTYMVYSAKGLLAWNTAASSNLTLSCTLIADIDMSSSYYTWNLVGGETNSYTGTFDGDDHTITGLAVSNSRDYTGLIAYLGEGGKVQNLTLDNVSITGSYYVGGVVGYNYGGTVTACTVLGSVYGSNHWIGGVVGQNYGSVTNCSASGTVSGDNYVGSVVGRNYGTVSNCTASGIVYGGWYVGGMVGGNEGGTVTNCNVSGSVNGGSQVGGVVGLTSSGSVTACTVSGDVSGSNVQVGGVAGHNAGTVIACYHASGTVSCESDYLGGVVGWNEGTVTACYASDNIDGSYWVGGVVGHNAGTVTACYWSDYSGNGIDGGSSTSGATKVGSDACETWIVAQNAMNTALANAQSEWRYENAGASADADAAPTLTRISSSE